MNFDANRLSKLSGLMPLDDVNVITESADAPAEEITENESLADDTHAQQEQSHSHDELPLFELSDDLAEGAGCALEEETEETEESEESVSLTMETLRETVLELRDEILAEQAAEKQTLAEAPVRAAIRKEIQALLKEMPADSASNWMYGSKGKPSLGNEKSRATTLFGVGFENPNK